MFVKSLKITRWKIPAFIRAATTTQPDFLENEAIVLEKHAKFEVTTDTFNGTSASIWPHISLPNKQRRLRNIDMKQTFMFSCDEGIQQ